MKGYKKQLGQIGEDAACKFLISGGFKIVQRNFRLRNAEIDIVAIDSTTKPSTLVFIEVKSRTSTVFGLPFEAIGYHKLQAMNRAALYYQSIHPELPLLLRLDAVSVIVEDRGKVVDITHIKNIG